MTLPDHVTDALEIVLITKDNLAGYHHRLAVLTTDVGDDGVAW